MKNRLCLIAVILLFLSLIGCASNTQSAAANATIDDLASSKIGLVAGSVQAQLVPRLLPDAEYSEFNSTTDAAMALSMGKIDAFPAKESVFYAMLREGQQFDRVQESVAESQYGMIFGKGENIELQSQFRDFLQGASEDGTLAALEDKWFTAGEPDDPPDYDNLTGENGTLKIAISSDQKPFSFLKNNHYTGFDIDVLTAFGRHYGYRLEIIDASFREILSGIDQGTYDIGASGVTITEERAQIVDFSPAYHTEDLVLVVRSTHARTLADFHNATLGVIDGSLYAGFSSALFPDAEQDFYPSFTDLFQCVKLGKIDGFLLDVPNFNAVKRSEPGLSYVQVPNYSVDIGYAFGKNDTGELLQGQMNEFLDQLRSDGRLNELWDKWCGDTEPAEPPAAPEFTGNTPLRIALDLSRKPFVYLLNNEYAGFEVEVLQLFCLEYGYVPEFESAQWTAGVAGLQEGKYDVLSCGIYMTEERKESVNFCNPYMTAEVIMVFYNDSGEEADFFASLKEDFEKTFLREERWKLILEGIRTTLIISFFAIVGGSLLGFLLYLLSQSKYRFLSRATKLLAKIYARIISGTPTLVILMILFYIIFGKSDISGVTVAIIGFTLTFGSFVYNHLTLTVNGVDRGQAEAAYALGYTRNMAFFRIILPQALQVFLPTYTGEIIGLIKATAVSGYIAVNDLTKMGDIIRSNTYIAFFPLIAVAVIYFAITWGAAGILHMIRKRMDPKKRKAQRILKGVMR